MMSFPNNRITAGVTPGRSMPVVAVVLVLLTLAVFGPALRCGFINYDDDIYVSENVHVQNGLSAEGIRYAFSTITGSSWMPLAWLSLMLDAQVFGSGPAGYHLTNVLLHAGSVLCLFGVLYRMNFRPWPSAVMAALFAVHPLRVESVAWISERKDVLSTFFWMLGWLAYVRYIGGKSIGRYCAVIVCFTLGLMAKPMLVTFPFALLILDYWPLGRISDKNPEWKKMALRLLAEKIPMIILSIIFCILTFLTQSSEGAMVHLPPAARLAHVLCNYLFYIVKTLWPSHLAILYPFVSAISWPETIAAGLILAGITFLALRFIKKFPCLITGWLWFLVTLAPVAGFIPVGGINVADRYSYIPSIGLLMAVIWLADDRLKRRGPAPRSLLTVAAVILILACSAASLAYLQQWQTSIRLFEHTLQVTERNYTIHLNLGSTLARMDQRPAAVTHFQEALRIKPDFASARYCLGTVLYSQGKKSEALCHYQMIVDQYKIGSEKTDRTYYDTINNMAWILSTSASGELRDPDRAVELAREDVLANPGNASYLDTLAVAYAAQGHFDQAALAAGKALTMAQAQGQKQMVQEITKRISLYESGKPWIVNP